MTLAVRVIPCLDVAAGRVVKGVNFAGLRDAGDPAGLAAAYDADGADELVFLDVTASAAGRDTMYDVVSRSMSATLRTPPPTVSGMNTCPAVRLTTSYMVSRPAADAVTSRNTSSSAPSAS